MKKGGRSDFSKSKNTFIILSLSALFLIFVFSSIVSAAPAVTINKPIKFGNYSTTFNVSITNDLVNSSAVSYNVTLYCNSSGGSVDSRAAAFKIVTISNKTALSVIFENASTSISTFADSRYYNCSAYADNGTVSGLAPAWSVAVSNVTFDSTPPAVSFSGITNTVNGGNYSGIVNINVSVSDATMAVGSVYFNITNSTSSQQMNFTQAVLSSSGYYNLSFSSLGFADGMYNITVYANDTLGNLNKTGTLQVTLDSTAPNSTYSCSPGTTTQGQTVTCPCVITDSVSGVNSSATSTTLNPGTSNTGSFTLTCSYADYAGNAGSTTASYAINAIGNNPSSPSSPSTTPNQTTNSYITVYAGTPAVLSNFDSASGISQIQLEVTANSYSVQFGITKYDSKPAEIGVSPTGDTYKYIHIVTQNLGNNLKTATMQIKVDKAWVSQNSLIKNDISLFRYNENSSSWTELATTYLNESSTSYYYTVQLPGFSYFAIAQTLASQNTQQANANNPEGTAQNTGAENSVTNYTPLFIVLGILVLAGLVIGAVLILKKIKR
jgi:PGF-pre-PGF domain-containing protein